MRGWRQFCSRGGGGSKPETVNCSFVRQRKRKNRNMEGREDEGITVRHSWMGGGGCSGGCWEKLLTSSSINGVDAVRR